MSFIDSTQARRFSAEKLQKLSLFESPDMFCDIYCLEAGQAQRPHVHTDATKFYYVLEGRGRIQVGEEQRDLGPGGLAWCVPGVLHGVENASSDRLTLLVAMAPNPNHAPAGG